MGSPAVYMGIVMVLLAIVLVGAFMYAWKRDRLRSHAVADSHDRLQDSDGSADRTQGR